MRSRFLVLLAVSASLTLGLSSGALAHPGGIDSKGGHTCRTNCPKWGLYYGQYHYHGGRSSGGSGSGGSGSGTYVPSAPVQPQPAPAPPAPGVEASEWTILVDGSPVTFTLAPRIKDGSLLVPAHEFLTALGATFYPGSKATAMDAKRGALKVGVAGDSKVGWANDLVWPLESPTFMYKGTLYAPFRFLSEALGGWVDINPVKQVIAITLADGDRPEAFVVGSSQLWVSAVMGPPLRINNLWRYGSLAPAGAYNFGQPGARYWEYGQGSVIEFDDHGEVVGWNDVDGSLKPLAVEPVPGATFGLGSTKIDVLVAMGTPDQFTYWFWRYGDDIIRFDEAQQVSGWENQSEQLPVRK